MAVYLRVSINIAIRPKQNVNRETTTIVRIPTLAEPQKTTSILLELN